MTLPQMPHSSFNANTQLKHALTYHAVSKNIKFNLCFTQRFVANQTALRLEISPPPTSQFLSQNQSSKK